MSAAARSLPPGPLRGELRPPGSKSIAQRALLAALLARGATRIRGLPDGEDVRAARELVAACGAALREEAGATAVEGAGLPLRPRGELVSAGESGTLARLALACLALCCEPGAVHRLGARGSLRARGQPALEAALRAAGAQVEGRWPLRVRAAPVPAQVELREPASSQEVSALLLALAAHAGPRELLVRGAIPSRPYVGLTRAILESFGAAVEERRLPDGERFEVRGPLRAPAGVLTVEPDASLAAVGLAAACLSGGEVRVGGLAGSAQGDARIVEHLRAFGCAAGAEGGALVARGAPLRGARLDLAGEPDLAPVCAAVAAAAALGPARASSVLSGLGSLQGKESARIDVLAAGLRALGLAVEAGAERLALAPPPGAARAARLDPRGDHRMAFAFALLGLALPGVEVAQPQCVAKSWPTFWEDLAALAP